MPVAYFFDNYNFQSSLESWSVMLPALFFLLKISLAIESFGSMQILRLFDVLTQKMPLEFW